MEFRAPPERRRLHEPGVDDREVRGAAAAAPRINPLTIVSAAVAGDDLESVARSAADALGRPVAIALPAFGPAVQWPPSAGPEEALSSIGDYATALVARRHASLPAAVLEAVPVRLGQDLVGVVAALADGGNGPDPRPWLDAAAAAAAVTALLRDSSGFDPPSARRAFLQMLELHAPTDIAGMLAHGRRLGCDLSAGAIGICAELTDGSSAAIDSSFANHRALLADVGHGRLLGLVSLSGEPGESGLSELLEQLGLAPGRVARSTARRDPAALHDALREASILLELLIDERAMLPAHEQTYRLLVGVMIRNPDELTQLRSSTIAELERYDELHDTELLATLEAFLAHHGSTTETAETMQLHRHTVGYRLARVHEVSGLSPYESEGRERLSLGLKADRIMVAEQNADGKRSAAPPA